MSDAIKPRILITAADENSDYPEYDHVIYLQSLFSDVSRGEIIETINRVASLEVSDERCIKYSTVWHSLAKPQSTNLIWVILFTKRLETHLQTLGVTEGTLICDDSLEDPYVAAVEDLITGTQLNCKRLGKTSLKSTLLVLTQLIQVIVKTCFILGDWLVAHILKLFRSPHKSTVCYVPSMGRLGSTLPVAEAFESKPFTLVPEPASYFLFRNEGRAALANYNPVTAAQHLSIRGLIKQVIDVCFITREAVLMDSFTPNLIDSVESEFNFRLESASGTLVRQTLTNFHLVRAILLQRSLRAAFSKQHLKKVVVGTLDPIGRTVVHEACERNLHAYHIPHSIATTHPPNPRKEVTQFVSGEMDTWYYKNVVPRDQWWDWVPLGRPYLSELNNQYKGQTNEPTHCQSESKHLTIVVATVSGPREVREQFITTMLESLNNDRFKIVIKPHPDEDPDLYHQVSEPYENASVITTDLYDMIDEADLTVTINSNVGLESIVIGTPAVCYNAWQPFILDQTYALSEEVPVFRSREEFKSFVDGMNRGFISGLLADQRKFVSENYVLNENVAENIAEFIESDRVSVSDSPQNT